MCDLHFLLRLLPPQRSTKASRRFKVGKRTKVEPELAPASVSAAARRQELSPKVNVEIE